MQTRSFFVNFACAIGVLALSSCQTVPAPELAPILSYDEFIKELKIRKERSLDAWKTCIDSQILAHKYDINRSWETARVIVVACDSFQADYSKYLLQQINNWPRKDALAILRQNPNMGYMADNKWNFDTADSEKRYMSAYIEYRIQEGLKIGDRCPQRRCQVSDMELGLAFNHFMGLTYGDVEYRFLPGNQINYRK